MLIRAGYEIGVGAKSSVPLLAMLSIHPLRHKGLNTPQRIVTVPEVPL